MELMIASALSFAATTMMFGCSQVDAPTTAKTANDCLAEHIKRLEGIRTFGSAESQPRLIAESVKEVQACGERALQNRISEASTKPVSVDNTPSMESPTAVPKQVPRPATVRSGQTVMDFAGIGRNATGKRKVMIVATQERIAKITPPQVRPILKDLELVAWLADSSDRHALMSRYSGKSAEASTLGRFTNMKVMQDCEKQARRILFFWDNHSYEAAYNRYDCPKGRCS